MPSIRKTPTALIKILEQVAKALRRDRFFLFNSLISTLPRPVNVLDVGGRQKFWEDMNFTEEADINLTILNLEKVEVNKPNFKSIVGDARKIPDLKNQEFDVVFSNSVIEHVGDYQQQSQMVEEIKRLGKRYFIQTPNYFFPLEPHFLFPCFQFFPLYLKVFILLNFGAGWYKKVENRQEAVEIANSITLLTEEKVKSLFPEATIYKEKLFGLTKSFIAYSGWNKQ